jgi:hypothetical protein
LRYSSLLGLRTISRLSASMVSCRCVRHNVMRLEDRLPYYGREISETASGRD